jgi:DHA2 family multidrug resistance protein
MNAAIPGHAYPDPVTRRFLTLSVTAATFMSALDTTIANVALPHMQGSVSASQDEITWVLTSYIVASAIFIPLCGWLANRYGRKRLVLMSVLGFTLVSALCAVATSLGELVAFRALQGVFGAALIPMSQAILLDINPPERHGQAMAIFGMGSMFAPIMGPVIGGWLTENLSWRWVFYVNVPFGILTFLGVATFLTETRAARPARLDLAGFFMLAIAIGLFQLVLDRGQQQDWFTSTEICIETALSMFFFYCFIIQTMTTRHPFIDFELFEDRNFLIGASYGFIVGMVLFSVLALLPTMLQRLLGYPVVLTGLVSAPRGIGMLVSTMIVGSLIRRVDARILMFVGFGLVAYSLHLMVGFSLAMDYRLVVWSGVASGFGTGLIFVPLATVTFATLDKRYRNEGTAMYTLIRNAGSAVGISVLQTLTTRNTEIVHSRLVEGIRPDNPVLDLRSPGFDFAIPGSVAGMDAEITRQASMVAYLDGYWLLFVIILLIMPFLFLLRPARTQVRLEIHAE